MSWDKIEKHLFEKYCIEGEDKELCKLTKEHDKEIRDKVIDEVLENAAKAICIGCGYLDGYKCTYKGANCGVSKPMIESITKTLEQMKNKERDTD